MLERERAKQPRDDDRTSSGFFLLTNKPRGPWARRLLGLARTLPSDPGGWTSPESMRFDACDWRMGVTKGTKLTTGGMNNARGEQGHHRGHETIGSPRFGSMSWLPTSPAPRLDRRPGCNAIMS